MDFDRRRIRASLQQIRHSNPRPWIDDIRGNFRERRQNEPAFRKSRVRYRDLSRVPDLRVIEKDVDVERSRTIGLSTNSASFTFDVQAQLDQLFGSAMGIHLNNGVEKPGLIRVVSGLGKINGRASDSLDARAPEAHDCRAEVVLTVAEIRTQAQINRHI